MFRTRTDAAPTQHDHDHTHAHTHARQTIALTRTRTPRSEHRGQRSKQTNTKKKKELSRLAFFLFVLFFFSFFHFSFTTHAAPAVPIGFAALRMSMLSPRPMTAGAVATAPALVWPPPPVAISAGCAAPTPLLALQRDLVRLCAPLERALQTEWPAHWDTMAHVIAAMETALPRWRTLLQADGDADAAAATRAAVAAAAHAKDGRPDTLHACIATPAEHSAALPADDSDDDYFGDSLPLPSAGTAHSDRSEGSAQRSLDQIGVLAALPGHVAKLALLHQRQVDVAYRLLLNTQSEHRHRQRSTALRAFAARASTAVHAACTDVWLRRQPVTMATDKRAGCDWMLFSKRSLLCAVTS